MYFCIPKGTFIKPQRYRFNLPNSKLTNPTHSRSQAPIANHNHNSQNQNTNTKGHLPPVFLVSSALFCLVFVGAQSPPRAPQATARQEATRWFTVLKVSTYLLKAAPYLDLAPDFVCAPAAF